MRPSLVSRKQWIKYNLLFLLEHFAGKKRSEKYLRPKMNALFKEIESNKGMNERGKIIDTAEIEFDSFEPFRNNRSELLKKPIVFRGVAKDWPCTKKWDKQFFQDFYANTIVPLIVDLPGIRDVRQGTGYDRISFAEYFQEIKNNKELYLSFSRVLDHNPELLEDLDLNWLRQFRKGLTNGEQTFFFMGEKGTKTSLHNGFTHTLFIQVQGRKRWILWNPEERIFLNPVADRYTHFYTHANPNLENDPKYPMMKYARRYEVMLEPGDVLWFPSLFWHYVENPEANIGVAYKFVNVPQNFTISGLLSSLIFMATKPNIIQSYIYNKTHKQDYVFSNIPNKKARKQKEMSRIES